MTAILLLVVLVVRCARTTGRARGRLSGSVGTCGSGSCRWICAQVLVRKLLDQTVCAIVIVTASATVSTGSRCHGLLIWLLLLGVLHILILYVLRKVAWRASSICVGSLGLRTPDLGLAIGVLIGIDRLWESRRRGGEGSPTRCRIWAEVSIIVAIIQIEAVLGMARIGGVVVSHAQVLFRGEGIREVTVH